MAEIVFLFPGQGSQYVGMGKLLAEQYPVAADIFQRVDEALGFPLSRLCFEGPEEELKKTENQQPALLTVSAAAFAVLREHGIGPDIVAGHSLGEYSALYAAGAIRLEEVLPLVRKRGQYMQQAVPPGVGAMAALLRLPEGVLDRILAEAAQGEIVTAANFNSPGQIVIAGHAGAVARAMELAKQAGAKRAIALPVSAPFHCPLMRPAQEKMATELQAASFEDLRTPLVNNWQAREITTGAEARQGLFEQIPRPVLWTDTIRTLAQKGVKQFIEVGAGGVLTGLCRSIEPSLQGAKFGEPSDWEKVKSLL